jgi:hypothetical protein
MKRTLLIYIALSISSSAFCQEKAIDTLKTNEVIVVKPYTPTISDAFKIKDNPETENIAVNKESISYSDFSAPVASTFTPTKGTAKSIVREPLSKIYENFIAAGIGNYGTPYIETFLHSSTSKSNNFGAKLKHHSSSGGIDEILIEDGYSDSELNLFYQHFERDYNWEVNGGTELQSYNWYGLPSSNNYDENFITGLDVKQKYLNLFAGGKIAFEDLFFEGGTLEFNHFSDDYGSSETQGFANSNITFPLSDEKLNTEVTIEYLKGTFEKDYTAANELNHSFANAGVHPSLEILRESLAINLGVKLYYSFDLELSTSKFYYYPNITTSFKLVDEMLIAIAGVTGDLEQNSYKNYVDQNPFVSPTLTILQTDQQYNAYIGAKGKLSSMVHYNITGSYMNEKNKPLFRSNSSLTDGTAPVSNGFEAGNSFTVVYDDIETIRVAAELNIDLTKELSIGGTLEFNDYTTTTELETWNLPSITSTIFADYQVNKWYLGSDVYFVGERKELSQPFIGVPTVKTLKSYIDLNFNGGYAFSDRLTAFAKLNNVLSTNYNSYNHFEVQGFQVLTGVIYKFNI